MGLCRVDTDRLRGLASQLGATAVALDDAAPAATLLAAFGYAAEAGRVHARLGGTDAWLAAWSVSLAMRADLVDAERDFFATPQWATSATYARRETNALLATHVVEPGRLEAAALRDVAGIADALRQLVAAHEPPDRVAAFFAGLDPAVVTRLAAAHPDLVGDLSGAPVAARFLANGIRVQALRAATQLALERAAPSQMRRLATELAVLADLAQGGRTFLMFDWDAGKIAEWIGPLHANHLAVYLPGAVVDRLAFPKLAAKVATMVQLDPSRGDLAVVAALAYETPPTIVHAASGSYADRGAADLVDLLQGISLTGRHLSLVGHSYGSVVIGEALQRGLADDLPADLDVIVLGSPGVRADHVAELAVDPDHFWAALLPGDEIASAVHPREVLRIAACATSGLAAVADACRIGDQLIHGANPATPAFGGQIIDARGDGGSHSDYLATSVDGGGVKPRLVLRQILRILVGRS